MNGTGLVIHLTCNECIPDRSFFASKQLLMNENLIGHSLHYKYYFNFIDATREVHNGNHGSSEWLPLLLTILIRYNMGHPAVFNAIDDIRVSGDTPSSSSSVYLFIYARPWIDRRLSFSTTKIWRIQVVLHHIFHTLPWCGIILSLFLLFMFPDGNHIYFDFTIEPCQRAFNVLRLMTSPWFLINLLLPCSATKSAACLVAHLPNFPLAHVRSSWGQN